MEPALKSVPAKRPAVGLVPKKSFQNLHEPAANGRHAGKRANTNQP